LYEQCASIDLEKYIYEVCPFQHVTQKQGSSSTNLGSYVNFNKTPNDEIVMKFDNGDKCWNGPRRSVNVKFECSEQTELTSIQEPSTCYYEIIYKTPLICTQKHIDIIDNIINFQFKTEL